MTAHSLSLTSQENNVGLLQETMHSGVELSGDRLEMRGFAHKKFMAAISRASGDDNARSTFTSSAENLGTAGWILTDLALRVAELADKKGI